jgi:hypothetical protein
MDNPVILLHGFSRETLMKMVEGIKNLAGELGVDPASLAFASTTPINLDWKIKKLIREVRREHEQMGRRESS